MSKKLIIANWKSNKSKSGVKKWLDKYESSFKVKDKDVVICPPFSLLGFVAQRINKISNTAVGVQDISPYPSGSYTGAVSAQNLKGFNVQYAIVGHSERRRYFHETHLDVANKVEQCLENDITPIVCVDVPYLADQAKIINRKYLEQCVVAYETPSAIGTGANIPIDKVKEVVSRVKKLFGKVRVLYGGSVEPSNYAQYFQVTDGAILGGASLRVDTLLKLVTS